MKKFLLLFVGGFLLCSGAFAQSPVDSRLVDLYGQNYINQVQTNNPRLIEYWDFCLTSSYYVSGSGGKDLSDLPDFATVISKQGLPGPTTIDPDTFNPLAYLDVTDREQRAYYRLGNTGNLIVFYSRKEVTEKFNDFKGLTYPTN